MLGIIPIATLKRLAHSLILELRKGDIIAPSIRIESGKPAIVIQLTGRRKKDGYIIWTLFHELGHILNDGNTGMTVNFIEGRGARAPKSDAEKRANTFAKEALLGSGGLAPYHGLNDSASIKAAAQARGACPGVVVSLMHRNHTLDHKWCNDLLVDMDIPFVG